MDTMDKYLISKDNGKLQLPYDEYLALMNKMEEAHQIKKVKADVLEQLQAYLGGASTAQENTDRETAVHEPAAENPQTPTEESKGEKVSVEFSAEEPQGQDHPSENSDPSNRAAAARKKTAAEIPPVKKEIEAHFNGQDGSGRLLNVFKQYYTCLNESCGGIVRVTMKDGVCSLWNYDEWEEFAFIDIHEGDLRISVDPRYTDTLTSLNVCEVPRLLASRRKLTAVQVGDLNKTMLSVLTKAFDEVGLAAG